MIERSRGERKPISVGLLGNAAEIFPELVRRGVRPDVVTDQTSAHDPLNGYLPAGWTLAEWEERRERDPKGTVEAAKRSMAVQVEAMLDFWRQACRRSTTATTSARWRRTWASRTPSPSRASCRPISARCSAAASGPFRWCALSGDPEDICRTDAKVKELIPDDPHLHNWLDMARERIAFQGLPARICWVGLGQRHRLGLAFNEMVATGELKAPIVIGRDHLDSGSVASPNRETEAMKDGSDAVSDWPLLNALLNCASRRDLGLAPPWRRRRHGLLAARRHGHRLRRHAGSRAPARARAVERPRDRRHAPRRRRLRGGDRLRARARAEAAEPVAHMSSRTPRPIRDPPRGFGCACGGLSHAASSLAVLRPELVAAEASGDRGTRDSVLFSHGSLSRPDASVVLIAAEPSGSDLEARSPTLGRGPGPNSRVSPSPSDRVVLSRPPGPGGVPGAVFRPPSSRRLTARPSRWTGQQALDRVPQIVTDFFQRRYLSTDKLPGLV